MTLNFTGPISLGGPTTGQSINLELGKGASDQAALNDTDVRALAQVTTPASKIVMPTDFWGKAYSYIYYFISKVLSGSFAGGGLVVDSNNNSYIASLDQSDRPTNTIGIQKYYPNNSIQAQKYISASTTLAVADTYLDFGAAGGQQPKLTLDPSNNLYFTHVVYNGTTQYSRITKLDSNLGQTWVRTYISTSYTLYITNPVYWLDPISGLNDYIFYAISFSYQPDPEVDSYTNEIYVLKLNASNGYVAQTNYSSFTSVLVFGVVTTATDLNRIYVGLSTQSFAQLRQYDAYNLSPQKSINFYDTNWFGFYGAVVAIGFDSLNYVYLVVNGSDGVAYYGSYLVKYDPTSPTTTIAWQRQIIDIGTYAMQCVATDSSNNIYVAGGKGIDPCIIKYNEFGVLQWARKFTGLAPITSIAIIDSKNTICITSNMTGSTSTFKVPTDGSKTGTYTVGGSTVTYSALSITDAPGGLTITSSTGGFYTTPTISDNATTQTLSDSSLTLDVTYL